MISVPGLACDRFSPSTWQGPFSPGYHAPSSDMFLGTLMIGSSLFGSDPDDLWSHTKVNFELKSNFLVLRCTLKWSTHFSTQQSNRLRNYSKKAVPHVNTSRHPINLRKMYNDAFIIHVHVGLLDIAWQWGGYQNILLQASDHIALRFRHVMPV